MIIATLAVVAFVGAAAWWATGRVQHDLDARARAALGAAGISADVRYSGSDAVLTGTVDGAGRAAEAIGVVAEVPGTRHVTSRLHQAADPEPADAVDTDTDADTAGSSEPTPSGTPALAGAAAVRLPRGSITFGSGDAALSPEVTGYLNQVAAVLLQHPEARLTVRGHSDNLGPDEINWALSKQRAAAVVSYLQSRQVPAAQLRLQAFAATSPVAANDTPQGRAANRRVELVIEEVP